MNVCPAVRRSVAVLSRVENTGAGARLGSVVHQGLWFVLVGASSTALNAGLYLLLRQWWDLLPANITALALSTVASTEANRLLAFAGMQSARSRLDSQSLLVFLFYVCYTSVTLWVLHLVVADASPETEALAVSVASVLGGLGRFLLLRLWVFQTPPDGRHPRELTRACLGYLDAHGARTRRGRTKRVPR